VKFEVPSVEDYEVVGRQGERDEALDALERQTWAAEVAADGDALGQFAVDVGERVRIRLGGAVAGAAVARVGRELIGFDGDGLVSELVQLAGQREREGSRT